MAKVLFICRELNPLASDIMSGIRNSGHDLCLITSANQNHLVPNKTRALTYFKKWNLFEFIRLLPHILFFQPQIIHFYINSKTISSAEIYFLEIAKQLKITLAITIQEYYFDSIFKEKIKQFVIHSDLITSPHREFLFHLRGIKSEHTKQIRTVLPPILKFSNSTSQESTELASENSSLYIPLSKKLLDANSDEIQKISVIGYYKDIFLFGDWDSLDLYQRKKFFSQFSNSIQKKIKIITIKETETPIKDLSFIKKNSFIYLAGLDIKIQDLTQFFEFSNMNQNTLIMDSFQSELYKGLWNDQENCYVLPKKVNLSELDSIIKKIKPLSKKMNYNSDTLDAPINELNRLYSKTLSLKYEKEIQKS